MSHKAHSCGCVQHDGTGVPCAAHGNANMFGHLEARLKTAELQISQLRKVIEGCIETFNQFCGESGAVIAHPPKCRFYLEGKQKDCNCGAKGTANDVLLSLRACRDVLGSFRKKCPSTYTHSTLGKLNCQKDEAHLNRRGDVEHHGGGVKWMSI